MLEVILYPVQGCSVGEGSFNREVDICEWTFEKEATISTPATASVSKLFQFEIQIFTSLTVQPVLWEGEEGAAEWRQGQSGHCVAKLWESWGRVAESFLDQGGESLQVVLTELSFLYGSGTNVAHGSNIWVCERLENMCGH